MRMLGGAPPSILAERQDEPVAVPHDQLALAVDTIVGTVENRGASRAQVLSKSVHSINMEIGVVAALSARYCRLRGIPATEEHLDVVPPHDRKVRWRVRRKAGVLAIPVAGDLEAEDVAVVLGGLDHIGHGELWHGALEPHGGDDICGHGFPFARAT